MRRVFIMSVVCLATSLGAGVCAVGANEPAPVAGEDPEIRARAELEKIEVLVEHASELHEAATGNKEQHACIELRLAKLKGLCELTRSAVERWISMGTGEVEREALLAQIMTAASRAEKLAAEIPLCGKIVPMSNGNQTTNSISKVSATTNAVLTVNYFPPPHPYVERDEYQCITQHKLAFLLAKAMGLPGAQFDEEIDWTGKLHARGIEPLGGWLPNKATDLDAFCAVVARALNLEVNGDDAMRFYQAVRLTGLPVDKMFPGHSSVGVAPYLLEAEVQQFFATGWGSPPSR